MRRAAPRVHCPLGIEADRVSETGSDEAEGILEKARQRLRLAFPQTELATCAPTPRVYGVLLRTKEYVSRAAGNLDDGARVGRKHERRSVHAPDVLPEAELTILALSPREDFRLWSASGADRELAAATHMRDLLAFKAIEDDRWLAKIVAASGVANTELPFGAGTPGPDTPDIIQRDCVRPAASDLNNAERRQRLDQARRKFVRGRPVA
jgi:hypothetical protein